MCRLVIYLGTHVNVLPKVVVAIVLLLAIVSLLKRPMIDFFGKTANDR